MPRVTKFKSVDEVLEEIQEGDLLEFRRLAYTHWAVYVGDGYAINVCLESKAEPFAIIKKELLIDIAVNSQVGSGKCRVNNLEHRARKKGLIARTPREIVEMAESKIGYRFEYRLFTENCEYFATSCRYGEEDAFSGQVQTAVKGAIGTGAVLTAAAFIGVAAMLIYSFSSSRSSRHNK